MKISARSITLSASLFRNPSIKFRHGPFREQKSSAGLSSGSRSSKQSSQSREVVYDFQLPMRFKRKPIDQEEMDYINRGGPA